MEKIIVGSVESGDLMLEISNNTSNQNEIFVNSKFIQQYGDEIKEIVEKTCQEQDITGLTIRINDQGAIPAVIRARVKTAIKRFLKKDE